MFGISELPEFLSISTFALGAVMLAPLILRTLQGSLPSLFLTILLVSVLISNWNVYQYSQDNYERALGDHWLYGSLFLWGPAFHFFYRSILVKNFSADSNSTLAFLPAVVAFFAQFPAAAYLELKTLADFRISLVVVFYVHLGFYITTSAVDMIDHLRQFQRHNASEFKPEQYWLIALLAIFTAIISVDTFLTLYALMTTSSLGKYANIYLALETIWVVSVALFLGFRSQELSQLDLEDSNGKSRTTPKLDSSTTSALMADVKDAMENNSLYLQPGLTLTDLSKATGQNTHLLSQVLNEGFEQNFYEFVNGYRILHAAKLLEQNPALNITQVAYEAGFANQVSFGKAFRKRYNQTPSAYRKNTHQFDNLDQD